MNDKDIEQLIQGKAPIGPRMTAEMVESLIKDIEYTLLPNKRSTVCSITLVNGFMVNGVSSLISSFDYDEEVGQITAHKKAMAEVWDVASILFTEKLHQSQVKRNTLLRGEQLHFIHHKGGIYKLLHIAKNEADSSEVAVYQSLMTGEVWTRPASEFYAKFTCCMDDPNFDYQKSWLQEECNQVLARYNKLEKKISQGQPENMTTAQWQLLNRHLLVQREDYEITQCRLEDC